MSTKIYNAYVFNGNTNDLIIWRRKVQMVWLKQAVEIIWTYKSYPIKEEITKTDSWIRFCKTNFKKEHPDKEYNIEELIRSNQLHRFLEVIAKRQFNEPLNIEASIVVYFHRKKIYVQLFGLEHTKIPDSKKYLIDFHYQNQCNKPERVSQREWNRREKIWDEILEPSCNPSFVGFCAELSCRYSLFKINQLLLEKLHTEKTNDKKRD